MPGTSPQLLHSFGFSSKRKRIKAMKLDATSAISFGDADLVASVIMAQFGTVLPISMVQAFLEARESGLIIRNTAGKYFAISRDGMINNAADYGISGWSDVIAALFTYKRASAKIQVLRRDNGHATCQQS